MGAGTRRAILLLAIVGLQLALTPGTAQAHAAFVSSEPEPGQELGSAPGVVVLRFTEPLNVRLSRATVTDPVGQQFEGEASEAGVIRVVLSTNAPGVYEVTWTTVSTVDGHTLRGAFRFGVGVSPGEGAEGTVGFAPQRTDLLVAVARTLEYAALLVAVGMLLLRRVARREPRLPWVRPRLRLPLAVALVSGIAVVVGEALAAAPSPSAGALANYLTTGTPGVARLTRLIAEALALLAATLGGRLVVPPLLAAIVALASAGHAAAVRPAWWGIGVDSLHLLAAGLWAGGILALATVRPPGGWRAAGRPLLDRFSPIALVAFLVTVGFGVLRGVQELGDVGDLVTSSYGQILIVKVAAVLAMVPLSVRAWRRLSGSLRLEAVLGAFVIAAAALLAAYPLPPGRAQEAEEGREGRAAASALPRPGDLTMGSDAGEVLVGLTVRPGEPGENQVLVYVLPLEGEEAAAGIPVQLSTGARTVDTRECAPTCRAAELELQGGERLEVRVGGSAGGVAVFEIPDLPAPDGEDVFRLAQRRMHSLETFRLTEVLSSGRATVRSTYAFQAPNRMDARVNQSRRILIGGTDYRQKAPGAPWEVQKGGPGVRVPAFIWDFSSSRTDPLILRTADAEGVPTEVISFVGMSGNIPIWFRLWVDREGLVRRAQMRAQGHFMDHEYHAFDAPFVIRSPIG